jgi:hypothetical protein
MLTTSASPYGLHCMAMDDLGTEVIHGNPYNMNPPRAHDAASTIRLLLLYSPGR